MSAALDTPSDPLLPPISPAAFKRMVRVGQSFKLAGFLGAVAMAATGHAGPVEYGLLIAMYGLTMLGVTAGLHRHFAHRAFRARPVLHAFLAVAATLAAQGSVLVWAALHRRHHQFSDRPGDPHSPHEGTFFHAHIGWILDLYPTDLARYVPDLMQDRLLMALHRRQVLVVWLGTLAPAAVGGLISGSWWGALGGFLFGGWARMFLAEQATCLVNSACHVWGSRPFAARDRSANLALLALPTLGESWHNNHHAFPTSARQGLRWWQLDLTWLAIRLWQALGLATDVIVPDARALAERRAEA